MSNLIAPYNILRLLQSGGPAPPFDLATLNLSFWHSINSAGFPGIPWAGKASVGMSGGRALTSGGGDPVAGPALNGMNSALWAGDRSIILTPVGTLLPQAGYYYGVLFYPTAIASPLNVTTGYDSPSLLGDGSGFMGLALQNSGADYYAVPWHFGGAGDGLALPINLNAWNFTQVRFTGAGFRAKSNSSAIATKVIGAYSSALGNLVYGANWAAAQFYAGRTAESFGIAADPGSDTIFDDAISYINGTYGLAF